MASIEELQERESELAVLTERARAHLVEVRLDNKNRESAAKRNYWDFADRHDDAASELRRALNQQEAARG